MTTYRLMDGLSGRPGSGPASPTSYAGNFLAGVNFSVTGRVMWFEGYWWWVPAGGDTGAQKFALWNHWASASNTLISGSVVTSGTLTAGTWNYIPLGTPLQLAPGTQYVAATGWSAVAGFPVTNNQFGSGDPYAAGITNGPLTAWSDSTNGGTNDYPGTYALPQGLFSTAGTDPSANMPAAGSNSANFWIDVQVSDTAPAGYAGSYRAYPNMGDALGYANDTANNFTLGTEFSLSAAAVLDNVWFYSPSGVSQLPTECAIYDVSSGTIVAGTDNASPSWKLPGGGAAAAGDGWMYAPMAGSIQLAASTNYRVVVFNGAATPAVWNCATANYWSTGFGAAGLTAGPISMPDNAAASSPGQDSYHQGTPIHAPDTSAGPFNYWLDVEVTPASGTPHTATASLTVTPSFAAARTRAAFRTGSLTVAPSLVAGRAHGRYRTGALTVTPSFSSSRTRGRYRAGSLTVTPSFAAGRAHGNARSAGLLVVPSFTAARMMAHVRRGSLLLAPSFLAVPSGGATSVRQTGSWWGLDTVFKQSREEFNEYASRPPMACPNDGEPLRNAPATASGSGVELFCPYCGFQYPRDWSAPQRPWY